MSIDGAKVSLAIELLNITSHSLSGEQSPHRAVRSVIQVNAALMDADFLDAFRYVVQSNLASNPENRLGYAVLLGDLGWALEPLADENAVCADLALIALRLSLGLIGNNAPQEAYWTLLERFVGALLAVTHDSQTDEYRQAMDTIRFVLHSSHVLPETRTRWELSISDRLLRWSEKNNIRTTLPVAVEILEGARARTSWIDEPELRFRCLYNLAQAYRYLTEATPWESIDNAFEACDELVAAQAVHANDNWYVLALILQGTLLLDAAMITRVANEETEILQRALAAFREARRCAERSEDFLNAIAARANLAEVYARQKTGDHHSNLEQAILEAEDCLAALRQTDKVGDVLTMCGKLGHYHLTLGLEGSRDHLADAMRYFEEALSIASSQNLIMKQAEFHACLGRAYSASDVDRAIKHFSAALGVLNAEANRDTYLDACLEFSKVLGRAERFKEGLEVLERAIHVLEEMRHVTPDLGMRRAVLDQGLSICREAAKFHLRLGNVDRAWMYCCMSKARFTIEYRFAADDANTRNHLALLQRASKLDRDYLKLRELELMSTSDSIESVERLHFLSKIPAIKQELKEAREAIKNVQSTQSSGPKCDAEWFEQTLVRTRERLASSATLLLDFYFVETELLVFVFDPTSRLLRCEDFSRNVFETVHEKYVAGPTGYFKNDNFLWRVCLEETINAVGASLKWQRLTISEGGAQALLIAPDGVLQFIPFHAIPIHGRRTIDVFPKGVSYTMTAVNSGSLVVERKHDTSLVTVVGNDEELIFSVLEVNYVKKLWRADQGEAIEVTQPSRGMLERAESIHVSAHGYSGFLDAGIRGPGLTYESVLSMRLSGCKLVVIGACESALSDLSSKSGDSVDLAEAFRLAGASNVVAALWTVDDLATFILMMRFYQLLWKEQGHAPRVASQVPCALGEAQRWLRDATGIHLRQWLARTLESVAMKDELAFVLERTRVWRADACPFSSPYYWAAFVAR